MNSQKGSATLIVTILVILLVIGLAVYYAKYHKFSVPQPLNKITSQMQPQSDQMSNAPLDQQLNALDTSDTSDSDTSALDQDLNNL